MWKSSYLGAIIIGVKGFCDIEIQFDKISVSTNLKRNAVLTSSCEKLSGYEFEAYGIEDYPADFYKGVAQALMQTLRKELREQGVDTLIALIASNKDAQWFYRNLPNAEIKDEGIWIDL